MADNDPKAVERIGQIEHRVRCDGFKAHQGAQSYFTEVLGEAPGHGMVSNRKVEEESA